MFGTPNANVDATEEPVGKAPLHTPVIFGTDAKLINCPSGDTDETLLNLSVTSPGSEYLTIVPILVAAKFFPAHVAIPAALIFNLSATLNPVGIFRLSTVSATKSEAYPETLDVS